MIMKSSTSKSSVISQILLAAVAIALGYLLLFGKSVALITLCQILCGGIVAIGVASIASFFLAGDYRRIDRYGFALGTLLVLMGLIGLIRINEVTANFEIYTSGNRSDESPRLSRLDSQPCYFPREHCRCFLCSVRYHCHHRKNSGFLQLDPSYLRMRLPLQHAGNMDLHPARRAA